MSVVFAFLLWFHVATNADYTYRVTVPVKYIEPSGDLVLSSSVPDTVVVYVKGTGRKLFPFMLRRLLGSDGSYSTVSLDRLEKGEHFIPVTSRNIYIPSDFGFDEESIYSNAVFPVIIDKKAKKEVPVESVDLPDFQVQNGCVMGGKPKLFPDRVTIIGPEERVNTLNAVRLKSYTRNIITLSDTLVPAAIDDDSLHFITVFPDTILVRFPVEPLETKVLEGMPVILHQFPKKGKPHLDPNTVSVTVRGPRSVVAKMKPDDILVTLNYSVYRDRTAHGDSLLEPLIFYPEGLTSVITEPKAISVKK